MLMSRTLLYFHNGNAVFQIVLISHQIHHVYLVLPTLFSTILQNVNALRVTHTMHPAIHVIVQRRKLF
jgi:hypothetical protein